jgi:hypothetical protein
VKRAQQGDQMHRIGVLMIDGSFHPRWTGRNEMSAPTPNKHLDAMHNMNRCWNS